MTTNSLYDHPYAQLPQRVLDNTPFDKTNTEAINYSRHGHPTKRIPAVLGHSTKGHKPYRVGYKLAEASGDHLHRPRLMLERWFDLANQMHWSPWRNRAEYREEKRWLFIIQNMAKHTTLQAALYHAVGIVYAADSLGLTGDHRTCFIGKRWLQLVKLPTHNKDPYTGKDVPYGHIGKRQWYPVGKALDDAIDWSLIGTGVE